MKKILALLVCVVMLTSIMTTMTVMASYESIDLSVTGVTVIKAGETTKIAVNGKTDVSDVTYQSSNPEFATVSDSGVVTGVKTGATTITVTSGNVSDSVMILVSDVTPKAATFSATLYSKGYVEDDNELKRTENSSIKLLKGSNLIADVLNGTYNTVSYWIYEDGTTNTAAALVTEKNKNVAGFDGIASPDAGGIKNINIYTGHTDKKIVTATYLNDTDGGFESYETKKIAGEIGWHQIVIRITDETLKVYYDGNVIFSGLGRQLVDFKNIQSVISGSTGSYNIADIQQSYTGVTEIDFEEGTTLKKNKVTFDISENGSVAYWKSSIADGAELSFSEGYSLKLKATPAEGYKVESLSVNGADYVPGDDGYVTFTVNNDAVVSVKFSEISSEPAVSVNATVSKGAEMVSGGKSYNSYIAYGNVANFSSISGYGMRISSASGATIDLPAGDTAEKTALQLLAGCEGKFAFRVFGDAVDKEKCRLASYIVVDDEVRYSDSSSDEFGREPIEQ